MLKICEPTAQITEAKKGLNFSSFIQKDQEWSKKNSQPYILMLIVLIFLQKIVVSKDGSFKNISIKKKLLSQFWTSPLIGGKTKSMDSK